MKNRLAISLCLGGSLVASISHALDLKQAKFTQVVNDVWVVSNEDDTEKFVRVNDLFNMPDLVRTGLASRAELVAADDTITRVGASTIFSFDPANRTIDLQKGSLLFHSPKGKGGGTIRTGSATASVLGTTLTVSTTPNGGFKVIDLEGHVAIKFANGVQEYLQPGQMTFILPGGRPSPVITIILGDLVDNSLLVQGFNQPLPSWPLIVAERNRQRKLIKSGELQYTGLLVGNDATPTAVQVIDANTIVADHGGGNGYEPPTTTPTPTNTPTPTPSTTLAINSSPLPSQYAFGSSIAEGGYTFLDGFLAPGSLPNVTIGGGGTLTLDLLPYNNLSSSLGEFAFLVPNGTLTLNNSVTFAGLPSTYTFDLYANGFSFVPGITVEADVGSFNLYAQTATTLNDVKIFDNALASSAPVGSPVPAVAESGPTIPPGGIYFRSPAALSLTNGSSIAAPNLPVHLVANAISLDDSTVQGSFVALNGATGVNVTDNSTVTASSGDLDIVTSGGGITVSNSALNGVSGAGWGDASTGQINALATGGMVTISNGATLAAGAGLDLTSDTGISISGSNLTANGGSLSLDSSSSPTGTLSVTGTTLTDNYTIGNITLDSGAALTVDSATITQNSIYAEVAMASDNGPIMVTNTSIMTSYLSVSALGSTDGTILLAGSTLTGGGSGIASLTAGDGTYTGTFPANLLTVSNSSFNSYATVNLTAYTISLSNVSFSGGTTVNLTSWFGGTTYSQATPTVGHINFLGTGNTYNGTVINQTNYNNGLYNSIHYSQLFD